MERTEKARGDTAGAHLRGKIRTRSCFTGLEWNPQSMVQARHGEKKRTQPCFTWLESKAPRWHGDKPARKITGLLKSKENKKRCYVHGHAPGFRLLTPLCPIMKRVETCLHACADTGDWREHACHGAVLDEQLIWVVFWQRLSNYCSN